MNDQWLNAISLPIGIVMVGFFGLVIARARIWRKRTEELDRCISELDSVSSASAERLRSGMEVIIKGTPWLYEPFYEWWEQTWVDRRGDFWDLRNALQSGDFLQLEVLRPQKLSIADSFPGLLTALGIFGTFLGIADGLSGIDLLSDNLNGEISDLVGGLKTAFGTSILGLALSMASTLLLNYLSSDFDRKRLQLIRWLDARVDRTTSQDLLRDLIDQLTVSVEHSERSLRMQQELLNGVQGLEHEIGSALEQAIQSSGLVKAVESMADSVAKAQSEGVGKIVDQFSEQMGERFVDQFDRLGQSLDGMVGSNEEYRSQMAGVVGELKDTIRLQGTAAERTEASLQQASAAADALRGAAEGAARAADAVSSASSQSATLVEDQNRAAAQLSINLDGQSAAVQQLTGAVSGLRSWHEGVRSLLDGQLEAWTSALQTQRDLTADIQKERETTGALIESLRQATTGIGAVQEVLGRTTGEIRSQIETSGRAREASLDQLQAAGRSLVDLEAKVGSSLAAFEKTAQILSQNADAVSTSIRSIAQTAKGQQVVAEQTERIANSLTESASAQERFGESIAQAATQVERVAELSIGLARAGEAVQGIERRLGVTSTALTKAAERLESRDREAELLWSTVTTELRQTTGDLTTGMAAYSESVNSGVRTTAKEFNELMAKAVGDLSRAAGSLSTAIGDLEAVVDTLVENR